MGKMSLWGNNSWDEMDTPANFMGYMAFWTDFVRLKKVLETSLHGF